MGVVGGVEEILVVELAEDEGDEDVVPGHGVGGMLLGYLLLNFEGGVEVEVVEVKHGLLDLGVEVDGVGVEGGCLGGGGGESEDEGENEGEEGERGAGGTGADVPERSGQAGIPLWFGRQGADADRLHPGPTRTAGGAARRGGSAGSAGAHGVVDARGARLICVGWLVT